MDPWEAETEPFDCESHEMDRLMVLCDDPLDLCVLCLDLWDFWVSSDAETSWIEETRSIKAWLGWDQYKDKRSIMIVEQRATQKAKGVDIMDPM